MDNDDLMLADDVPDEDLVWDEDANGDDPSNPISIWRHRVTGQSVWRFDFEKDPLLHLKMEEHARKLRMTIKELIDYNLRVGFRLRRPLPWDEQGWESYRKGPEIFHPDGTVEYPQELSKEQLEETLRLEAAWAARPPSTPAASPPVQDPSPTPPPSAAQALQHFLDAVLRELRARIHALVTELVPPPAAGQVDLTEQGVREPGRAERLSPQEQAVVSHVAEGKTNKEIAAALNLSEKTVKNYLANVYQKLDMSHRSQVAAWVVRQGWEVNAALPPPPAPSFLERRRPRLPNLSPQEQSVATYIAEGKSNWDIAKILGLSERGVRFHVDHIFNKLDVTTRAQVAAWVVAHTKDTAASPAPGPAPTATPAAGPVALAPPPHAAGISLTPEEQCRATQAEARVHEDLAATVRHVDPGEYSGERVDALLAEIRAKAGRAPHPPAVPAALACPLNLWCLFSGEQRQILPLAARGVSPQDIAQQLGYSGQRVSRNLRELYQRLRASTAEELAALLRPCGCPCALKSPELAKRIGLRPAGAEGKEGRTDHVG